MIAVDTNVLVYAHGEHFPKHSAAKHRLIELAKGRASWGLPSICVHEFLRVVTHPRLLSSPYSVSEATDAMSVLLESPNCTLLLPADAHWHYVAEAVDEADARGNLVFDAAIVAICRENGVSHLLSEDRDFDRFVEFPTLRL